jgi:hypothetical protein
VRSRRSRTTYGSPASSMMLIMPGTGFCSMMGSLFNEQALLTGFSAALPILPTLKHFRAKCIPARVKKTRKNRRFRSHSGLKSDRTQGSLCPTNADADGIDCSPLKLANTGEVRMMAAANAK